MADNERMENDESQSARLTREIDEAELFVQRLCAYVVAIRDELAAGHTGRALSMCNQALTEIDSATDVVASSPRSKEQAGLDADFPPHGAKRG